MRMTPAMLEVWWLRVPEARKGEPVLAVGLQRGFQLVGPQHLTTRSESVAAEVCCAQHTAHSKRGTGHVGKCEDPRSGETRAHEGSGAVQRPSPDL